jgi:hypothetical protein
MLTRRSLARTPSAAARLFDETIKTFDVIAAERQIAADE